MLTALLPSKAALHFQAYSHSSRKRQPPHIKKVVLQGLNITTVATERVFNDLSNAQIFYSKETHLNNFEL